MDGKENNNEFLTDRIKQLERERDELRKDIEQLCLQQAGPGYLAAATRMHFQRTAGLELEIENLKTKLVACTRNNHNLQEELSEVYHIKSQLAELHSAEILKNVEAEKQLRFFQNCVGSAFSERDQSLMEAVKAKEQEEAMSDKLNDLQNRIEELTSDYAEEKKVNADLQIEVTKLKQQNANCEKLINKFYEVRQSALGYLEDIDMDDKCNFLLSDPPEMWSFNDPNQSSTSKYVASLEKELEITKISIDDLRNKLHMGLEIEEHLKRRVCKLEERHINSKDMIRNSFSMLHNFHAQHKRDVLNFLEEEKSHINSLIGELQERMMRVHLNQGNLETFQRGTKCDDIECRDVHISSDVNPREAAKSIISSPNSLIGGVGETSEAFAQALQEKVATLLLLSQQEERHLLERDVNVALQKKLDELQKNLLQVTNEKVKALMELAQLRQEYYLLQQSVGQGMKLRIPSANDGDRSIAAGDKLKGFLRRTYLRRWVGQLDHNGDESDIHVNSNEGNLTSKVSNSSVNFARLKVENATLQEGMASIEHLTSSVHRLRLSLLKAKETLASSPQPEDTITATLNNIITEANLVKTALRSSLPVSWSIEADLNSIDGNIDNLSDHFEDSASVKVDTVSAAGFEMVELLILAAKLQMKITMDRSSKAVEDQAT